jgi:hypothetical protein
MAFNTLSVREEAAVLFVEIDAPPMNRIGPDFRRDSDLFGDGVRDPEAQGRIAAALRRGFQTREAELTLARMLGELGR